MLSSVWSSGRSLRSLVYDALIVGMTSRWYRQVLLSCPVDTVLLDVGIGTATSLISNRDIILSKGMTVIGVDYDEEYVTSARKGIANCSLRDVVQVEHASIHEYNNNYKEKFDLVDFSGSLMIIPQQSEAIRHCVRMLRNPKTEAGCIFFTQTFEKDSALMRVVTPLIKRVLKFITTIDFGEVTYEKDFVRSLADGGVEIVEKRVLSDSLFRTQVLVVARPVIAG